jgi:hypothetical protein
MDIMSMFRAQPAQPAAAQPTGPSQVNQPGVALPGTQSSPQTASNGMVPSQDQNLNVGQPNPNTPPASPLDTFKDVWQTPTNSQTEPNTSMFGAVDQQKMMEAASKVDFAKAVTPEQLQAIGAGGDGAVAAFAQAMNKVAQTVYAQSAFATTKIVDQALAKQQENFDARLPSMVKKFSVNENLQTDNPLLSNPALTPLVSALSDQLVRKNPNATSAEIQQQVNDYFAALGTTFAPKPVETPASRAAAKAAKQEDWSAFLGMPGQ